MNESKPTGAPVELDLEPAPCPLCTANDHTPAAQAYDRRRLASNAFQLVRCQSCSLVYQHPRVRPASIGKYYAGDYHSTLGGLRKSRREANKRQITSEFGLTTGKLLDIGCAHGGFLVEMRSHGWLVEGVEFSPEASKFCRDHHNLMVATGDLSQRPDDGTRFDLITMWAVLPHVPNPVEVVRQAAGLLKPDGVLLICVANIESWAFKIRGGAWGHLDQPRHYCMFSPQTLERLYEICALSMSRVIHDDRVESSQIVIPPIEAIQRRVSRMRPGWLRKAASKACRLLNWPLAGVLESMARARRQGGIIIASGRLR